MQLVDHPQHSVYAHANPFGHTSQALVARKQHSVLVMSRFDQTSAVRG